MADDKKTETKTVAKIATKTSTLKDITFDFRKKMPLVATKSDNSKRQVYWRFSASTTGFSRANTRVTLSQIEDRPVYYIRKYPESIAKYSSATAEQLAEIQKLSIQDAQNLYR